MITGDSHLRDISGIEKLFQDIRDEHGKKAELAVREETIVLELGPFNGENNSKISFRRDTKDDLLYHLFAPSNYFLLGYMHQGKGTVEHKQDKDYIYIPISEDKLLTLEIKCNYRD